MRATPLFGQPIADEIYSRVVEELAKLKLIGKSVSIRAILIGQDPASVTYLKIKGEMCRRFGIGFEVYQFEEISDQSEIERQIQELNSDSSVTGIIVQLPVPGHLDREKILRSVNPAKDIDAFCYTFEPDKFSNYLIRPPAPSSMLAIVDHYRISLTNKKVVVVGNGLLVGQPLISMLRERQIDPLLVDSNTSDSEQIINQAEVIFSGVGQPDLITASWIRSGVVIIDAGYAKVDGQTVGDVSEDCWEKASAITPAVGGIGPLTVAYLLNNAVLLAQDSIN